MKLLLIVLVNVCVVYAQIDASAEYLKSAIKDIQQINNPFVIEKSVKRNKPLRVSHPVTIGTDRIDPVEFKQNAPALSLTKGELLALYDSAVKEGNVLNPEGNIHAIELPDDSHTASSEIHGNQNGYYYYYYPLKTLLDDIQNETYDYNHVPQPTVHSHHTHLHNVKIEPLHEMAGPPKYKGLEPLFMAISSFIGMTLMFVFSMILLPRFGVHKYKYKSRSELLKPQILSFSEILFEAIEGHDCRERIYCEAGKVLKALHMNDNRFIKFFQRMSPTSVAKSIEKIRQQAQKKRKCVMIQCKRKKGKKNKESKTNPRPISLKTPK